MGGIVGDVVTTSGVGATLASIRLAMGNHLNIVRQGTVDGAADLDSFICTDLKISKTAEWRNGWVRFDDAPSTPHVVTGFNNATGNVDFKPARAATASGAFEIWRTFSPWDIDEAINQVLTEQATYADHDETEVFVAGTYIYNMDATAIRLRHFIWKDSNDDWQGIGPFEVYGERGSMKIELLGTARDLADNHAGATLRISYDKHYTALADDGSLTTCPIDWLKKKAEVILWAGKSKRPTDPNRDAYLQLASMASQEAEQAKFSNTTAPRLVVARRVSQ